MKKHNEQFYNDPWDRDFYETGSTKPPKDRGGIVAVLLVLVLILGGTCSALGIINLRLLQQIAEQGEDPGTMNVFESTPEESRLSPSGDSQDSIAFARIGLEGQTVTDFDRRFYELPQGFLVTDVTVNASAHQAGIHAGDVITRLGNQPIASQENLAAALETCQPGDTVKIVFYRHQTNKQMETEITLPKE